VLDFWATWCVPCVKAFPKMAAIQKQYSKEVQVIAVSNESPDRISRFIKNLFLFYQPVQRLNKKVA
ncbi:MAG TPA: TlpA disulfide reductase family protein, partial [Flavisolibacter sp.]